MTIITTKTEHSTPSKKKNKKTEHSMEETVLGHSEH